MDEQEAREWLLKRRGGLGISGIDPPDWGSDLADLMAPEVLAKAALARRMKWTLLPLLFVVSGLWVATVYFCYAWLVNGASGMPALFAGIAFAVVGAIGAKIMKRLEDGSPA